MSRTQQDQVIDDEESETCPLCIEEFDLSDRNFKPCPCGYQICQFCYNNIKTSMNGLCPACRRTYDDKNIQWKSVSAEEIQSHRDAQDQRTKKKQVAKQKEAARREADALGRKHLAGIRVRQKNLVYVTGMRPTSSAEHLSEILRSDEYFGQYGKIIKVVVSKAKDTTNPHAPVGVYVTFANKDDASKCIAAVDGSPNYDTKLRAQYGTTKYCSAYLRGENCTNRNCMFLHEPGEESESFSRQDLSSMNVISTQSPSQANMISNQPPQPQPPPQQAPQSIAAAWQPPERQDSKDENASQGDSNDGSALPSSVSWANRNASSGRNSQTPSVTSPSPLVSSVLPSSQATAASIPNQHQSNIGSTSPSNAFHPMQRRRRMPSDLRQIKEALNSDDFKFKFDMDGLSTQLQQFVTLCPPLFDLDAGVKRRSNSRQETERNIRDNDNQVATRALAGMDFDEAAEGGSLQLGGEPEDRQGLNLDPQHHDAIRRPSQERGAGSLLGYDQSTSPSIAPAPSNGRSANAQYQQFLLQQFKSASPNALNQNYGSQYLQSGSGPGHARHASRYSFANDTSASASVKPVADPKLMSQQSSMMPPSRNGQYNTSAQQQPPSSQFFSSGIQGPPPGLKATGTPSVSGGGMFGQGHGFATAGLGYGINSSNHNVNDQMMQELLRNRGSSAASGQTSDQKRHELTDPSILQARMHQTGNTGQGLYNSQGQEMHWESTLAHESMNRLPGSEIDYTQNTSSGNSSTRSRPVAPPGLLPFASTKMDHQIQYSDPSSDLPLMPELGRVPLATPKPQSTGILAKENPVESSIQQSAVFQPKTETEPKKIQPKRNISADLDSASFPALPKPSQSRGPEKSVKGNKPSVDQSFKSSSNKQQPHSTEHTSAEPKSQSVENEKIKSTSKIEQTRLKKLDTSGAVTTEPLKTQPIESQKVESQSQDSLTKVQYSSSTTPASSRPHTPGISADVQPSRVRQPQTLRVIADTKIDTSSPNPAALVTTSRERQHSRDVSVSSSAIPETPASETATGTTSRPSSPGGQSRIGSLPVRNKTKSQTKKERKEKITHPTDASSTNDNPPTSEVLTHEPIIGRKKKTKAPANNNTGSATATSTPGPSRAASPGPDDRANKAKESSPVPEAPSPQPASALNETVASESQSDSQSKVEQSKKRSTIPALTLESILQSKDDPTIDISQLLKTTFQIRHDLTTADLAALPSLAPLSAEEIATLDSGNPVYRNGHAPGQDGENRPASRLMISPFSRATLRNLTPEQEKRYLELDARIQATRPFDKYHHESSNAAFSPSDILKAQTHSFMRPQTTTHNTAGPKTTSSSSSPEPKPPAYGDDALQYLDRFILPPAPQSTHHSHTTGVQDSGLDTPPISSAIPRTYTTGDPTYSVSGIDIQPTTSNTTSNLAPPTPPLQSAAVPVYPLTTNPSSYPFAQRVAHPSTPTTNAATPPSSSAALGSFNSNLNLNLSFGPHATGANLDAALDTEEGRDALATAARSIPGGMAAIKDALEAAGSRKAGAMIAAAAAAAAVDSAAGAPAAPGSAAPAGSDNELSTTIQDMLVYARKENEGHEKRMAALVRKNRKVGGF